MVAHYTRDEFLNERFDYEAGEHIAIYATTGSGKSFLAQQLADKALEQNPGMRYVTFMPKPADSTTLAAAQKNDLRVEPYYPFKKKMFQAAPRGHVFMPPHITDDNDADVEYISKEMKRALTSEYWKGNVLSFVDDALIIEGRYKSAGEIEQYLTAGRSNHAGVMFALQQPKGSVRSGVSSFHFSQPTHMFFGAEAVEGNRERFGEIAAGIDPRTIERLVSNLQTRRVENGNITEWLYVDRRGPYAAIVGF